MPPIVVHIYLGATEREKLTSPIAAVHIYLGTAGRNNQGVIEERERAEIMPSISLHIYLLGVTSCPPPTWRYGPRKSML